MRIRTIAAVLLVSGPLVSPAAAQTAPPGQSPAQAFHDPVNGLSLDQAVARGLTQEPSLRAQRTMVDVARGAQQQAGLRRNPAIGVDWRWEPGAGADNQMMLTVDWPLEVFRREGRVAVAGREVAVVEASVADRERLLAAEVRARYGEALVTVRELMVLDELVTTARRQHDLLRARVELGSSPPLERDVLEVELRRLEADRLLQLGRIESALFGLKRVIGMPPAEPLRLRDTLEDVVRRESTGNGPPARDDRPDQRADVKEAAARIGLAEAKVDRAHREGRFDVSVIGGYTRMNAGFPQFGLSTAGTPEPIHNLFHYASVGAMVTIPVFNRSQGDAAVAQAERSAAAASLDAVRLSAETEMAAARARDQRAQEAARVYAGPRTLARQNLTVVEQSYGLGRATVFDVVAEQKRYLELERAYTETLRAAYEARTALKRALGDVQ